MKFSLAATTASLLFHAQAATYTNDFPVPSTPGIYEALVWYNVTAVDPDSDDPEPFSYQLRPHSGGTMGSAQNSGSFKDFSTFETSDKIALSARYPQSTTMSFNLDSFWYACQVGVRVSYDDGAVYRTGSTPANCTWTVKGYTDAAPNGFPLLGATPNVTATGKYTPPQLPGGQWGMRKFDFSQFNTPLRLVQMSFVSTAKSYTDSSGIIYDYVDSKTAGYIDYVVFSTNT